MKKIVLIMVMSALLDMGASAQIVRPSRDTLPCDMRHCDYYYSSWYDTNYWYFNPEAYSLFIKEGDDAAGLWPCNESDNYCHITPYIQQFTPRAIRIKGMWAMVHPSGLGDRDVVLDSTRLPEYLSLYIRDTNEPLPIYEQNYFLERIASARWDTATPKMMCMSRLADDQGSLSKMYCHLYEALFDSVYTVVGEYWLGGTANSNSEHYGVVGSMSCDIHDHWPTIYVGVQPDFGRWLFDPYSDFAFSSDIDGPWNLHHNYPTYGPYGVIIDEVHYHVELSSADNDKGFARATACYPAGSYQTITATAHSCYLFSHWNDGVTDNPRTIHVTQDTAFTAYFDEAPRYRVGVRSNDTLMGGAELHRWRGFHSGPIPSGVDQTHYYWVDGTDTVYCGGDTVRLRATAYPGFYFWQWDDGVRENPRTLKVTQDTLVTAIFSEEVPPPYVPPCPIPYKVVPVIEDIGRVRLVWPWSAVVWPRPHTPGPQQVGWELALGRAGTPPDYCQIIQCATTEKLLNNIEPGVQYVAYVRTLCNYNDSSYYSDWSDGVEIYFPINRYTVTVTTDHPERGRVYGGGVYDEGAEATVVASATSHHHFLQWDDGVVENPRTVRVTQDTAFTALFSDWQSVMAADSLGLSMLLLPNPASGSVVCVMGGDLFVGGVLTMTDATGREVLHKELPPQTSSHTIPLSGLAKGVYFVTLVTAQGSTTKKLLVE